MRRTLACFVLIILAVIASGCAQSDQRSGNAPNDNATGTTTYSNSSVPMTASTPPPGGPGGGSSGGAAPKTSPTQPGIKPPTE